MSSRTSAANSAFSTVVVGVSKCQMPSLELMGYTENGTAVYKIEHDYEGKVVFKWSSVYGAGSYRVYRTNTQNGKYKLLGETKYVTFTDKTADAGTYNYYKIVAVSKKNSKANSAAFKVAAATCYHHVENLRPIKVKTASISSGIRWRALTDT